MIHSLELPVLVAPGAAAAVPPADVAAQGADFTALLAGLLPPPPTPPAAAPEHDCGEGETGNDVPLAAAAPGNLLPPAPAVLTIMPALPVINRIPAGPAPDAPDADATRAAAAAALPLPLPTPLPAPDPRAPVPARAGGDAPQGQPAPRAEAAIAAPLPMLMAQAEAVATPAQPPVQAAAPAAAQPAAAPVPGVQLEQLVEALAQAREAGRGARGDMTVRHADFGLVAIRLEQDGLETRAQVSGRDPAFAPAIVAALAERSNAGFADTPQRGQDQGWGQSGTRDGAPGEQHRPPHERRPAAAQDSAAPRRQPADAEPSDHPLRSPAGDPHHRFA